MADHVLGVGLASHAEAQELATLVAAALEEAGVPRHRVGLVATVATRAGHPALAALGWPVVAFPAAALGERTVAEPAALLAAGPGAVLVVPKRRSARATVAVARAEHSGEAHTPSDVRSSRPQSAQVSSS